MRIVLFVIYSVTTNYWLIPSNYKTQTSTFKFRLLLQGFPMQFCSVN